MKSLLDSDLKHCDLDTAIKIVEEYNDVVYQYLNEHMDIYDDFQKVEQESDYSLAEYLWYGNWEEVVDYLRGNK